MFGSIKICGGWWLEFHGGCSWLNLAACMAVLGGELPTSGMALAGLMEVGDGWWFFVYGG